MQGVSKKAGHAAVDGGAAIERAINQMDKSRVLLQSSKAVEVLGQRSKQIMEIL